ncbi:MAG TPA: heparan-alpha-glucosaminide N-acetyltransferase domain-containing protein [Bryobacteraceae bacterium]|nr:heparan-alpha-glucosaminide N-acetyltransferase domain-containing protein [Bryobacteraceae bacterium]
MTDKTKAPGRLAFIDWTRGFAAVIMLQGHTFHSFTRNDLRDGGPYILSQFVGGLPPAMFLFLTGITFAFLMHSKERQGASAREKLQAALRRSGYLFLLAFLFRIQLYVFGFPSSPASELLRVDILNCMGMTMLVFAPMALFTTHERIRLCTVLGVVVAALAPVITSIDGPGIPWLVHAYFFPSFNYFGFFPWAAFLAFGMAAGSIIRVVKPEEMGRAMLWMTSVGVVLVVAAQYLSNLPYSIYPKSDYWLNSPGLTAVKLGIVLCILAGAFLWVNASSAQHWSVFRQLGTTSLLVYWVHIELVYGRWFGFWKEALTVQQVVIFSVALLALMTLLSVFRTRGKSLGSFWRPTPVRMPGTASGD